MAIERKKTSLYLDVQLVQAAKVLAANSGKREYQIFEDALRQYIDERREAAGENLRQLFDGIGEYQKRQGMEPLTEDQAVELSLEAQHLARSQARPLGPSRPPARSRLLSTISRPR